MTFVRSSLIVIAALCARASVADCAWVVDAEGACVHRWAASDLLRGPTAIVNAPLLPVRNLVGGAEYAWNKVDLWPWQIVIVGPVISLVSAVGGVFESTWWVGTGVAETLTGGYFALTPDSATQLSLRPEVSRIIADAEPTPTPAADRCGRVP